MCIIDFLYFSYINIRMKWLVLIDMIFLDVVAAELKMLSESGNYTVNPDHTVVLPCVVQDQGSKKVKIKLLKICDQG